MDTADTPKTLQLVFTSHLTKCVFCTIPDSKQLMVSYFHRKFGEGSAKKFWQSYVSIQEMLDVLTQKKERLTIELDQTSWEMRITPLPKDKGFLMLADPLHGEFHAEYHLHVLEHDCLPIINELSQFL